MLNGVAVQALEWESYEAVLWSPCSFSKTVHMTSSVPGEEKLGESPNCLASDMKGQGV